MSVPTCCWGSPSGRRHHRKPKISGLKWRQGGAMLRLSYPPFRLSLIPVIGFTKNLLVVIPVGPIESTMIPRKRYWRPHWLASKHDHLSSGRAHRRSFHGWSRQGTLIERCMIMPVPTFFVARREGNGNRRLPILDWRGLALCRAGHCGRNSSGSPPAQPRRRHRTQDRALRLG